MRTVPATVFHRPASGCSSLGRAFTLVELLVVIAVIAMIPLREAQVIVPSDMIAIGDLGVRFKDGHLISLVGRIGFDGTASFDSVQAEQDAVNVTKNRHGSRANMVFCDGHVEGLKFTGLSMNQDRQLQRWNSDHLPHRELVPATDFQP